MLRFIYCNVECHYTGCHYADCLGASITKKNKLLKLASSLKHQIWLKMGVKANDYSSLFCLGHQLSNGGIHLGINYSVSNEMKQDE